MSITLGLVGYAIGFSLGSYAVDHNVETWVFVTWFLLLAIPGFIILALRIHAVKASWWWMLWGTLPIMSVVTFARLGGGQVEGDWWYKPHH